MRGQVVGVRSGGPGDDVGAEAVDQGAQRLGRGAVRELAAGQLDAVTGGDDVGRHAGVAVGGDRLAAPVGTCRFRRRRRRSRMWGFPLGLVRPRRRSARVRHRGRASAWPGPWVQRAGSRGPCQPLFRVRAAGWADGAGWAYVRDTWVQESVGRCGPGLVHEDRPVVCRQVAYPAQLADTRRSKPIRGRPPGRMPAGTRQPSDWRGPATCWNVTVFACYRWRTRTQVGMGPSIGMFQWVVS